MRPLDLDAIKEVIENSSPETEIMIGCDSNRYKHSVTKRWHATYAICVVIHVDGNRGCQVYGEVRDLEDFGNLKQRLLTEVGMAIEVASELVETIGERPFEIHLDINTDPKHKSQIAMKECIGWVRGMFGFDPKLKPDAPVASYCADHWTR